MIRFWKIGECVQSLSSDWSRHGSVNDDTGGRILPERQQQLSRQRHDRRLAQPTRCCA
jgi:hypothetical protein